VTYFIPVTIKSGPRKVSLLIPFGKPYSDYVRRSVIVNRNAVTCPKVGLFEKPALDFTGRLGIRPPGIRGILEEMPLNSDIVVVFYKGVGGFLYLPGRWV
jgi:hypothetical protein